MQSCRLSTSYFSNSPSMSSEKKTIYFCYVYETLPPMFSFGTSMWLGAYKSKSQCNVVRLIRAKGNDKGTWFLICRFKKMFVQKHKEPND